MDLDTYLIEGGTALSGCVPVQGSKNGVLPILAATILAPGESVIHNCPDLTDVTVALEILSGLGCRVTRSGATVAVDATGVNCCEIPHADQMRASVLFLGSLLARLGEAKMSYPGGCALGARPIDLHCKALERLGAKILPEQAKLHCRGNLLYGRRIVLRLPSVGATENTMLAACSASGMTILQNAAREPEIVALQAFLRSMGAHVWGAGGSVVVIEGGFQLHPGEYTVPADRIVAATYLTAVAVAGGEAEIVGVDYRTISPVVSALAEAGCTVKSNGEQIYIRSDAPLRGITPIYTAPYPGFPTDVQPILMAALAGGIGRTRFVETVFENRYRHVEALCEMGAEIHYDGRVAEVRGVSGLHGATMEAYDLRGGAALVVAALGAQGSSSIRGLVHIDRGYEKLDRALRCLGATIERKREPNHKDSPKPVSEVTV